jgi:MoaA/NifB/PqqE/SkfB family radical SAM enzyme
MPVRDPRPVRQVIDEEGIAAAIGLKHVAGVLYTYRCTLACAHCCFNCCPDRPDRHTPHDDALEHLRQMHAIDRVVHIAGGEAMMHREALRRLCREAGEQGVAPHFIETNATFASSLDIARERLTELRDCGVEGLLISSDPYHQAMCPPAHFGLTSAV